VRLMLTRDGRRLVTTRFDGAAVISDARTLRPQREGLGAAVVRDMEGGQPQIQRTRRTSGMAIHEPRRPHARHRQHRRHPSASGTCRRSSRPAPRCPACPNRYLLPQFTPDGAYRFAIASGPAYRWDVRPSSRARHACAVTGRQLTRSEWDDALPERDHDPAC
jgi:hypothetical protein